MDVNGPALSAQPNSHEDLESGAPVSARDMPDTARLSYADDLEGDKEDSSEDLVAHEGTCLVDMRIIYSDMNPKEIRTTHTVAAAFLGVDSSVEHVIFDIGVRERVSTGILWGLWCIGASTGLMVIAGWLPMRLVWFSLLMLPLPVVTLLLLCTDLLKEIARSMDLYIIYILQFALFIDGVAHTHGDLRRIFWICYLPTQIAAGVVDAYPAKYRAFFAKLFYGGALMILVVWNLLLAFKWRAFDNLHELHNFSWLLHHLADQLTLAVFYGRHLYCSIYYEEYFVLIKADVLTRHKTLEFHGESATVSEAQSHLYLRRGKRESTIIRAGSSGWL
jgi:hypothetical protein